MIRAFIAIPLPDEIKETLLAASDKLKGKTRGAKWVRSEALHITLKFLGNIPEDLVDELSRGLDGCTRPHPVFELSLSALGAFPGLKRPRVVWAGLTGEVEELSALARSVETACARCGIPEEKRPFAAHITLGRLKVPTVLDLDSSSLDGKFTVSEVLLIRSELLPGGPRYTVLHRSSLESKGG